ncbi:MAG: hypothetical protein JXB85_06940 [Anaerolineales bacterium]|nr:hypothetical protein [Anaerolineales bacterium]
MLILTPVIILLLNALLLLIIRITRPNFRHIWLIAAIGSLLAIAGVFLWRIDFPQIYQLPAWQPEAIFRTSPAWIADGLSWPYALALTVLSAAVVWTAVVRIEPNPMAWAGAFLLSALGILAVAAENPLTLVLVWAAIDLAELITMIRSTNGESQTEGVIVAFSARLAGTALVLWAGMHSIAAGISMDFTSVPAEVGLWLLIASGLRLGILPLHLPYQQETTVRRGFGTSLRLVAAASSLALLARISPSAIDTPLTSILTLLVAVGAVYTGWMWLRASDELTGRPFWVLGMASLAIAASLRANPIGSVAWGSALILGGGILFLYSARQRVLLWLLALGLLGVSALPFTATASGWHSGSTTLGLLMLPYLPAHALLLAGCIRHALHPGETSFESQQRWIQIPYLFGLALLIGPLIMLGIWGWSGAELIGIWWVALLTLGLAAGLVVLADRMQVRGGAAGSGGRWADILRLNWLYRFLWAGFRLISRASNVITNTLEGDGGILWSLVVLVLLLTLFSSGFH